MIASGLDIDEIPELKSVQNNRKILTRCNNRYSLHHKSKDGSEMWRCTHRKTCNAKLKILGDQIMREDQHSCAQNQSTFVAQSRLQRAFKDECTEKAKNVPNSMNEVYKNTVKKYMDAGQHLLEDLPSFTSVKSNMYRARNASFGISKTQFRDANAVNIPAEFEGFLLHDHREEERIMIFSSNVGRTVLEEKEVFFCDGTFRSCPSPFYQLYTIHADTGNSVNETNIIPVLFAFLPNKSQKTYEIMFNSMKQSLPNWKPRKLFFDFEVSAMSAAQTCLPDVTVKGSNFHFKQALLKKAKTLGLSTKEEMDHVAKCTALAHLPISDVEDGWLAIIKTLPTNNKITIFNNYFVGTWLKNKSFLYEIWNCGGERHRTMNSTDAWHKKLLGKIKKKPRLLEFLFKIRERAEYYEQFYMPKKLRKKSIERDNRIKLIELKCREKSISIVEALDEFKTLML